MSPTGIGILGIFLLLFVLFFLGMPVGFAMTLIGFAGFCWVVSFKAGINMMGGVLWATFSKYGLTVIPMFILMGQIAYYSGINEKLYRAAYQWFGHIRGGIAIATVMACSAFSAICGSNAATAATMTSVALPQMKKYRYHPMLSTGSVACGSTLGVVIPPSVVLIVIGLSTNQSIARLFYGGVGAGVLLSLLLMTTVWLICVKYPQWGPVGPKTGWKEKVMAIRGAFEMVLLFLMVMLGLYFGFFTPAEAGAAGALLALILSLAQGRLHWKGFWDAVQDTLRISCMVIMIVAGAVVFGRFLAVTRIPFEVANWVAELPVNKTMVMAVIFMIYIIGGAVMDALALLLITLPVFFPVAEKLGYDPVWFSVTITVITTLGAVTPPVGATTYVVGAMAGDVGLEQVFKGVAFFIPAYIVCVILLMLFPEIITLLPALIR
jgi:tripartite ATP-independent transporter DctM subunit